MAKRLNPKEIEAARRAKENNGKKGTARLRVEDEIQQTQKTGGVVVIPPQSRNTEPCKPVQKLRVAAYCRVSTQEEEQIGSFEMQVFHFTQVIESNPDWELVEVFKDKGKSGTTVTGRKDFQRMMERAVAGDIDLILTKSISRFGRNIVDILNNLRVLSALNPPVAVQFETEGMNSIGDGSNNLLLAILSALAEMESQQKSEAIKAGIRWRMAEGIYKFSVNNTLGYYRDHFGRLLIEPTEAKIVQYIYESCLDGASPAEIACSLTEQGISSPMGKDHWYASTVKGILRNEKYCGDALMQKTYTRDFREHRGVKNTELNMYFKEGHHKAIIKKADWERVQVILDTMQPRQRGRYLRPLVNRFVVRRSKNPHFKNFYVLDPRWTSKDRAEFTKLIDREKIAKGEQIP